jgi:hypothetical protein
VSDPASITISVASGVLGVALFTALAMSLQWLVQAMRPKKQERAASADPSQRSEPPKIGDAWGDDILAAWDAESDQGENKGPFDYRSGLAKIGLTGADVFYLAAR